MSKIGRNDPCPCGSGKKYKNCCINVSNKNYTDSIISATDFFKKYNPLDLLLWLQIILVHPNNSIFLIRIEYLIALLFSIPIKDFKNEPIKYKDVKYFFDCINDEYARKFFMYEDFAGFDQNKLIPFFFEGEKYYFFYGGLERPFEYYKKISDIYFTKTDEELLQFKDLFVESLKFQTILLEKITSLKESFSVQDKIYIPSQSYYDQLSPLFKLEELNNSEINFGFLSKLTPNEIIEKAINAEIYKDIIIETEDNSSLYLYPHIHNNILLDKGLQLLSGNSELMNKKFSDFRKQIFEICSKFFTVPQYILRILEKFTNINLIEEIIDFACLVDGNKLFLFSGTEFSENEDISKVLSKSVDQLIAIKQRIKSNDIVGIDKIGGANIYGVPTMDIEIFCFPVYEVLTFDCFGGVEKKENDSNIYPISYSDLKAVFERIGEPMDFLKFLREDFRLIEKNKDPFMGEFMDRFSFYLNNGKSYSRSGRVFDMIMFVPHMWHDHVMNELYEKYKDSAFEVIEKKFPGYFNVIKNYLRKNIYRMLNTANLHGAYLTRWERRDLWIYPPLDGYTLDLDDIRIGYDMLMPLFADYLEKLEKEFEILFTNQGVLKDIDYSLFVFPKSFINSRNEFDYLKPLLNELSENKPIVFKTLRYYDGKVRTSIVFEKNYMHNLFGQTVNSGERYCIKELVKSLLEYSGSNEEDAEKISMNFINANIKDDLKGYSLELLPTYNPRLNEYNSAVSFNETDISIVNREISDFLIKNNYSPSLLKGDEAKELNYKIYDYLQNVLEAEINNFDKNILFFAYRQLELNEGYREKERVRKGMQAKGRVEFNVLEKLIEDEKLDSQLSMSIKHIIHTILKCNPNGDKSISNETWSYLLAITTIILETTMIYDFINYDIKKHYIKISEDFLIEDIEENEVIDSLSYFNDNIKKKLDSAKRLHTKVTNLVEEHKYEKVQPMPKDLMNIDDAFKQELDFKYENLIFVLMALTRLNLFDKNYFPLSIVEINDIIDEIQKADKLKIDDDEIIKIIKFLSLSFNSYNKKTCLIPSEMMREKQRINVSPFIKLSESKILYGSQVVNNSLKFWERLIYGEFPFQLSKKSLIQKALNSIHRDIDLELEKDVEERAIKILGKANVEARVNNFRRLSLNFNKTESCGEIDLLCINRNTFQIFVLDAKNINIKISLYQMRQNIDEFYKGEKSYYSKLMKKKKFIEENKIEILKHFNVNNHKDWQVREGFITSSYLFAKYFTGIKVDFVLLEELDDYLNTKKVNSNQ